MINKSALTAAILFALIATLTGAVGTHLFRPYLTTRLLEAYETAVRYQYYYSFTLAITGILYSFIPYKRIIWAIRTFIMGSILFSGSIYLLVYQGATGGDESLLLVLLTPIGGVFLITGWVLLLIESMSYGNRKIKESVK